MASLHQLLKTLIEKGGSDLHITVGSPPVMRVDGEMVPVQSQPLTGVETKQIIYSILTDAQKHEVEEENELDLSFGVKGLARFRANVYVQRGTIAGAFRVIPFEIKAFHELGLPDTIGKLAERPRGLVLVTGSTGSGKSTTLSAMIDKINTERAGHIVTIEDPIEFIHQHKRCIINQREVGSDTVTFQRALKSILRQDPDVVLVGELRDRETIEAALTISETGHLCFATLHTNTAVQTISRILDVFPANQQPQVRAQLSFVLEGVVCQTLLPKVSGVGRALAYEILVPNAAIRNLIREDKIHQVYNQMQIGQAQHGMMTMNQCLLDLVLKREVTTDMARSKSTDLDEFKALLEKAGIRDTGPAKAR